MKTLLFISTFIFFASCQTNKSDKKQVVETVDPCSNLKDTFNTVSVFGSGDSTLPTKDFYEIVKFIESKGNLRLTIDDNIPIKIDSWKDIYLRHTIDTCNHKYVTQNFILKNITATSCYFKSKTPLKGTKDYYPRFNFIQWNFANNVDRDSAFKIMNWVYTHDDIIAYEYRYNQTVVSDKRLYLIEPGAKIFEETGIEYGKYLKQYLGGQTNNSH